MAKHVRIHKTRVIQSKKDSSHTEQSAYWDDYDKHRGFGPEGHGDDSNREDKRANPDVLPEAEVSAPSTPQLIYGEAVEHLQGRQREIYLLTMREDKSLGEAAEVLGLSKGTAQKYKERAIKFIEQYCKAAIAKGRV